MARLSTGQLPACAPRMRTKITVSSPISRKKKIVTSCVSKINFLLQLYFVINSLMCLSEARSIFITLFFLELGSSRELEGAGKEDPMLGCGPFPHPQKLLWLSWKAGYWLCEGLSGPSDSFLMRCGLWHRDSDPFLHLLE